MVMEIMASIFSCVLFMGLDSGLQVVLQRDSSRSVTEQKGMRPVVATLAQQYGRLSEKRACAGVLPRLI